MANILQTTVQNAFPWKKPSYSDLNVTEFYSKCEHGKSVRVMGAAQ